MIKFFTQKNEQNIRIDKFLCAKFDISFGLAQKLIREGKVKINNKKAKSAQKLEIDDKLEIFEDLKSRTIKNKKNSVSEVQKKRFSSWIIYEDDKIIALNKPSGLATQGGSGVKISVDDFLVNKSWQLVHRLDKDTSGVLLIAKDKKNAEFLIEKFRTRKIKKTYLALVSGVVNKDKGIISIALLKKNIGKNERILPDIENGKEAVTKFEVMKKFSDFTLVKLMPITGRTHQLRVHMKELGHPIINDVKYGRKIVKDQKLSNRLCLHAHQITIDDYDGKKLTIKTDLPDFLNNLDVKY